MAIHDEVVAEFAVPVSANGRVLGVLNVESTDARTFTPGLVELLRTVAVQVAGAVRLATTNARLTELLDRYVGPDLARSLLADPTRFRSRGERREATGRARGPPGRCSAREIRRWDGSPAPRSWCSRCS